MFTLASLLPGVRNLRAPFAAGLLWLVALLLSYPNGVTAALLDAKLEGLRQLAEPLGATATVISISVFAFIVGNVSVTITSPILGVPFRLFERLTPWAYSRIELWKSSSRIGVRPPREERQMERDYLRYIDPPGRPWLATSILRLRPLTNPYSPATIGLMKETASRALSARGGPGVTALFPIVSAVRGLPNASPQLSKESPIEYQEYDRLRSESEFRHAIVPPLVTAGWIVQSSLQPWVGVGASLVAIVLLVQAASQARAAMTVLANSAYVGHLSLPMLQAVTEAPESLQPPPATEFDWMALFVIRLHRAGYRSEAEQALLGVRSQGSHYAFIDSLEQYGGAEIVKLWEDLTTRRARR